MGALATLLPSQVVQPFPTSFRARRKLASPVVRPELGDDNEMKVAAELRQRFLEGQAADSEFLKRAKFELDFLQNHWIEEETGQNLADKLWRMGRSAFQIDMLTPSMDVIINQIRINKSTANFLPIDGDANEATAEVRQGLYRDIERVSKGFIARETAYQFAVSVGRGYWRVTIEDEDGPTFAQRIGLQRVDNLNSIIIDPTCLDFTYSDAGWAYAWEVMDRAQFKAQFHRNTDDGIPLMLDTGGLTLGDMDRAVWFPQDKVIVGEYFKRVWKMRTVVELPDGTSTWKDEVPEGTILRPDYRYKEKLDYHIEWRKMTGTQTLEKRIWPGRHIPIIVCVGREIFRGNKPKLHSGMIRPAIDPSRTSDAATSRALDEMMLSPLPHLMAEENQLSPEQESIVNNINQKPWSVVKYKAKVDSVELGMPKWSAPGENVAPAAQMADMMASRLDRVLSVYAPQRGQPVGDMSGVAQRQLKDQGDASHAAFPDNFQRALLQEATVVNDLMDVVYTDQQAITITLPDDRTKQVLINQEYVDPKTGKKVKHVFGSGRYGVAITTGQSYPTRMAEAADRLLSLAKLFPQMANTLDLMIKDLNIPNAQKYEERLRPPGIKSEEDGPTYAELSQQNQQLTQTGEEAHAIIEKLIQKVDELGAGEAMKRLELASKERIAAASDRTQLTIEAMKEGREAELLTLRMKGEAILKELERQQPEEEQAAPETPAAEPTAPVQNQPVIPSGDMQQGLPQ